VIRDMRVQLPALLGVDRDTAISQLKRLGLKPEEQRGDSWIDRLIPGALSVCETSPAARALVQPGSTVTVVVAKTC
jgi:beta-lactam-binding protein with PASTA domain